MTYRIFTTKPECSSAPGLPVQRTLLLNLWLTVFAFSLPVQATWAQDAPASKAPAESVEPVISDAIQMPLGTMPDGIVTMTLVEQMPSANQWLKSESPLTEAFRWSGDSFLIPRIPGCYDDWGIRDSWKGPVLLTVTSDVLLAPGHHHFLLRARGLARLWIDDQVVAETKAITAKPPDGEQPVTPLAKPPLPGHRVHGYRQQEVSGDFTAAASGEGQPLRHRVVLEILVGGPGRRTETGEVLVATLSADQSTYHILRPGERGPLPLTDKVIEPELERIEGQLRTLEDETRRAASQSMADYWDRRHELARAWVKKSPDSPPAEGVHPVDAFIHAKIRNAHQSSDLDSQQSQLFHDQVLPILRDHCFRCHGDKNKGDLRLNSRDAILKAGESGQAAVVPGDPHASGLMEQVRSGAMPPTDTPLTTEQIATLERWIAEGATWPNRPAAAEQLKLAAVIDDQKFVRRAYLDAIGLPPNPSEVRSFLADPSPDKRRTLVKHLLNGEAVADHWMSYWQDVLAENPTLINQSMGSTGPFRWFLHDSLRDRKAMDRMVTELVMMRGSAETGGSAAFGMSGESDAPLAAKSHILSGAFLGIDLQCARCHDSPYHSTLQRDLYSMAAMLDRKVVTVPASSRVPAAFFERKGRQPLIEATLKPDEPVPPVWPFQDLLDQGYAEQLSHILQDSDDTREQFAVMLTSPFNRRFPRVLVNRVWKRLMGAGMVEPVHDWEGRDCSHPELMDWLADELVRNDYDLMSIVHIVMTSECYMREALGANLESTASGRFFNAPDRRRLTAEQIVDSLFAATGRKMETEELTFVYDGQRALGHRQTLGQPTRAWMFASLNNERDRPSLALPGAQSIVDVLEAFGWNGNRQQPIQVRESDPNVLQPGILANGSLTAALSRASFQSEVARLALESASPDELVEEWFLRLLSRYPTDRERILFSEALSQGFSNRVLTVDPESFPKPPETLPLVTWFNHLRSETTVIQQEHERRVKQGPPTDPRLETKWREIYEDFIWSLINHGEFVWVP